MQVGRKAQGFRGYDTWGKLCERRHGGGGNKGRARRARADREERRLERIVRRDSKDQCREGAQEARER